MVNIGNFRFLGLQVNSLKKNEIEEKEAEKKKEEELGKSSENNNTTPQPAQSEDVISLGDVNSFTLLSNRNIKINNDQPTFVINNKIKNSFNETKPIINDVIKIDNSLVFNPSLVAPVVDDKPSVGEPIVNKPIVDTPVVNEPVAEEPPVVEPIQAETVLDVTPDSAPISGPPPIKDENGNWVFFGDERYNELKEKQNNPSAGELIADTPVVEETVLETVQVELEPQDSFKDSAPVRPPVVDEPIADCEPIVDTPVVDEPVVVEEPVVETTQAETVLDVTPDSAPISGPPPIKDENGNWVFFGDERYNELKEKQNNPSAGEPIADTPVVEETVLETVQVELEPQDSFKDSAPVRPPVVDEPIADGEPIADTPIVEEPVVEEPVVETVQAETVQLDVTPDSAPISGPPPIKDENGNWVFFGDERYNELKEKQNLDNLNNSFIINENASNNPFAGIKVNDSIQVNPVETPSTPAVKPVDEHQDLTKITNYDELINWINENANLSGNSESEVKISAEEIYSIETRMYEDKELQAMVQQATNGVVTDLKDYQNIVRSLIVQKGGDISNEEMALSIQYAVELELPKALEKVNKMLSISLENSAQIVSDYLETTDVISHNTFEEFLSGIENLEDYNKDAAKAFLTAFVGSQYEMQTGNKYTEEDIDALFTYGLPVTQKTNNNVETATLETYSFPKASTRGGEDNSGQSAPVIPGYPYVPPYIYTSGLNDAMNFAGEVASAAASVPLGVALGVNDLVNSTWYTTAVVVADFIPGISTAVGVIDCVLGTVGACAGYFADTENYGAGFLLNDTDYFKDMSNEERAGYRFAFDMSCNVLGILPGVSSAAARKATANVFKAVVNVKETMDSLLDFGKSLLKSPLKTAKNLLNKLFDFGDDVISEADVAKRMQKMWNESIADQLQNIQNIVANARVNSDKAPINSGDAPDMPEPPNNPNTPNYPPAPDMPEPPNYPPTPDKPDVPNYPNTPPAPKPPKNPGNNTPPGNLDAGDYAGLGDSTKPSNDAPGMNGIEPNSGNANNTPTLEPINNHGTYTPPKPNPWSEGVEPFIPPTVGPANLDEAIQDAIDAAQQQAMEKYGDGYDFDITTNVTENPDGSYDIDVTVTPKIGEGRAPGDLDAGDHAGLEDFTKPSNDAPGMNGIDPYIPGHSWGGNTYFYGVGIDVGDYINRDGSVDTQGLINAWGKSPYGTGSQYEGQAAQDAWQAYMNGDITFDQFASGGSAIGGGNGGGGSDNLHSWIFESLTSGNKYADGMRAVMHAEMERRKRHSISFNK